MKSRNIPLVRITSQRVFSGVFGRVFGDEPVDRVEDECECVVVGHRCDADACGGDLGWVFLGERYEIRGRKRGSGAMASLSTIAAISTAT